ncbi:hypothetical protein WDZ92_06430 [Nostoc sp. NIES-2111]
MFNLPNELRDFYKFTDRNIPKWKGVEVLPPKTFKPNIDEYFKRSLDWKYEYKEDGCNWDVVFDYGISRVRLYGQRAFCTRIDTKIVNQYKKDAPLMPISIPDLNEELNENACWINILWNKEVYVDGARDITQNNTGEAWKFDEVNIELLKVKYPVEFEKFYTGAEITVKITYQSRQGKWFDVNGQIADKRYPGLNLGIGKNEFIHTYKVWDKHDLNNPGTQYIIKRNYGEYLLLAPGIDAGIMLVYIDAPRWLIEDRWGENATSQYAIQLRSFYSDELIEYDADGTRDNRKNVTVSTPLRNYQITRYTDDPLLDFFGVYYRATWTQYRYITESWEILVFQKDYDPKSPPPYTPPPDEDCECMCCPNDGSKQDNDELLRLILQRIGTLPAQVPNRLTDRTKGRRTINSLSEFMAQQIRLMDDIAGYFPLEIELKDSDLTQEGNQTERIKIDNIAEALTELIGLALVMRTESSATLNTALRTLVEAGSAKQAAIVAHDYAQANADFLGYNLKQVEKEVGFTFSPGESKIEDILQEKKVKVKTVENVDKETFQKAIYPLLEMAARWNAQNWVNLGKGNAGDALKSVISTGLNALSDIDRFVEDSKPEPEPGTPEVETKSKFDDFLEEVENGFSTQDGITSPENPYGYPYNERPRIRQLGNTFEQGEDDSQS